MLQKEELVVNVRSWPLVALTVRLRGREGIKGVDKSRRDFPGIAGANFRRGVRNIRSRRRLIEEAAHQKKIVVL